MESDAELVDMHTRWHCLKERILDLMKFVHAIRVMGRQQVVLSAFVWPCALDLPGAGGIQVTLLGLSDSNPLGFWRKNPR